ncbi:MAG TPA: CBS domain-containing protein [Candidatus Nitrosotalea sp.]|jgi:acetoin utilization protein AcuB|nr:CBS domain-containing protein [Candidatus Nitrosotalea sp.]
MIARDLMTPDVATVTPKTSIAEVWDLMREADIRHVPVVEGASLVGMLSDRDLARLDLVRVLNVQGVDALQQALATPVLSVMQPDVIFVEPDAEAIEVIDLLIDHKIGALPVVETGTRSVIGIISYVDVLRALQSRLEED